VVVGRLAGIDARGAIVLDRSDLITDFEGEIENALSVDDQRIGDVYRAWREDKNRHPRSIAEELNLDSIGQVYTHLGSIETLLQGRIYGGETYAPQKATMLRSFVRRHSTRLSEDTKKRLLILAGEHGTLDPHGEELSPGASETDAYEQGKDAGSESKFTELWDEFIRSAQLNIEDGGMGRDTAYKLEMGRKLVDSREVVLADGDSWSTLVKRGIAGNLIFSVQQSKFRNWLDDSPEVALQALQAIWAEDDSDIADRIRKFGELLPTSVLSGGGTRMNVISVLLMGLDSEQYPPFRVTRFDEAYERIGYEPRDTQAGEAEMYGHALDFLDTFIEEAGARGIAIRHRLDAQSLVWLVTGDYVDLPSEDSPLKSEPDLLKLSDDLLISLDYFKEWRALLEDKRQVIFQGPPGTGKTYIAQELAKCLAGTEDRVTLVQFHPSYAYEDFVQGYRPKTMTDGQPGFELRDGPLLKAAAAARDEPDTDHFLVIDEINRGNIASVFGELYFLLEYRDRKMNLQYSDAPFSLPENLYIIGTMNTSDRSIALVDLALRRRFHFVDFYPDEPPIEGLLRRWFGRHAADMEWVANVLEMANDILGDRNAAIGPSHFMKKGLTEAAVDRIWRHSVLPHVEERLQGERERLEEFSLDRLRRAGAPSTVSPTADMRNDSEQGQQPDADNETD